MAKNSAAQKSRNNHAAKVKKRQAKATKVAAGTWTPDANALAKAARRAQSDEEMLAAEQSGIEARAQEEGMQAVLDAEDDFEPDTMADELFREEDDAAAVRACEAFEAEVREAMAVMQEEPDAALAEQRERDHLDAIYLPRDQIDDARHLIARQRPLQSETPFTDVTVLARYSGQQPPAQRNLSRTESREIAEKFLSLRYPPGQQEHLYENIWGPFRTPMAIMMLSQTRRELSLRLHPILGLVMDHTKKGEYGDRAKSRLGFKSTTHPMGNHFFQLRFSPDDEFDGCVSLLIYRGVDGGPIVLEHLADLMNSQTHRKFLICFWIDQVGVAGGFSDVFRLEDLLYSDSAPCKYVRRRWASLAMCRAYDHEAARDRDYQSKWAQRYRTQDTNGRNGVKGLPGAF